MGERNNKASEKLETSTGQGCRKGSANRRLQEIENSYGSLSLPKYGFDFILAKGYSAEQLWRMLAAKPSIGSSSPRPLNQGRKVYQCHSSKESSINDFFQISKPRSFGSEGSKAPKDYQPKRTDKFIVFEKQEFRRLSAQIRAMAEKNAATQVGIRRIDGLFLEVEFSGSPTAKTKRLPFLAEPNELIVASAREQLGIHARSLRQAIDKAKRHAGSGVRLKHPEFFELGVSVAEVLPKFGVTSLTAKRCKESDGILITLSKTPSAVERDMPVKSIQLSTEVSFISSVRQDCVQISDIQGLRIDLGYKMSPWVDPRSISISSNGQASVSAKISSVPFTLRKNLGSDKYRLIASLSKEFNSLVTRREKLAGLEAAANYMKVYPEFAASLGQKAENDQKLNGSRKLTLEAMVDYACSE